MQIDNATHRNNPSPHETDYRPDIDGLRAIAVLSVVGFHAFPQVFKGGFIGVDIFFVISGYLISKIILINLAGNEFSFSVFYGRRIRRIFPALVVVLVTCLLLGWFTFLSSEYRQLGKHAASGASFISNLVLWNESGYFDNAAETKPLLHLWSLGVEEQFYFAWPLMLWLAWKAIRSPRKKTKLFALITFFTVASFVLNILLVNSDARISSLIIRTVDLLLQGNHVQSDQVGAFYSPLTRFWELLFGSLLALLKLNHSEKKEVPNSNFNQGQIKDDTPANVLSGSGCIRTSTKLTEVILNGARNLYSFLGFSLIGIGFFSITKDDHFPGWWALLPTLGTVILISSGPKAWINKAILNNRYLVGIGIISYPLYLWHWPLLSFARIIEGETPTIAFRVSTVMVSGVLAWLTYKFIEKPIRFGGQTKNKTLAMAMTLSGIIGGYIFVNDGLDFRSASQLREMVKGDIGHEKYYQILSEKYHPCKPDALYNNALKYEGITRCLQSQKNTPNHIALIGDSHAEHLFSGLADNLKDIGIVYYIQGIKTIKEDLPLTNSVEFHDIFNHTINDANIKSYLLPHTGLAGQINTN